MTDNSNPDEPMDDSEMAADRQRFLAAILDSEASHKVIVAGPGTGKTYSFKELLKLRPEPNLVLTFINNLARDLADDIGPLAEVRTFHSFCRRALGMHSTKGITRGVDYYPLLGPILASDATRLLGMPITSDELEKRLHRVEKDDAAVVSAIRSGNYYNSVGHTDGVFRVLMHYLEYPEVIPQYSQIVVDEFQDFSLLEVQLIHQLASESPTLIAGDDDQALYGFKGASPDPLRQLMTGGEYTRFELPYCTRCPGVLVDAVNQLAVMAIQRGLLVGRIDKKFWTYVPEKRVDSSLFPKIIHAHCTVQRNNAPYMARYIRRQIEAIPPEHISQSNESGYPTVLVTGPTQFCGQIYEYLTGVFQDVEYKRSSRLELNLLDGYQRVSESPTSRLGWRIIAQIDPPPGFNEILKAALEEGHEFVELLPESYRSGHMEQVSVVQRMSNEEDIHLDELARLVASVGLTEEDISLRLCLTTESDDLPVEEGDPEGTPDKDSSELSIIVTSLPGAKGLQASHVFVVGLNEGHFPKINNAPTDAEVCSLIVALTRATKSCHLVSCWRFGGTKLANSVFLSWLDGLLEPVSVNAAYFKT